MRWREELRPSAFGPEHDPLLVWRAAPLAGIFLAGLGLAAASLPLLDAPIARLFEGGGPSGDVRREIEAMQQFGAVGSVVIAAAIIASLDPRRLRRFLDYALALGVVMAVGNAMKLLIGRGRPKLGDPMLFLGPTGSYPVESADQPIHAWELAADGVATLHAMPSTHAASAAVLAIFLATLYPRLRWFAIAMVVLVSAARIILSAHWTSDVIVGATLGIAIATPIIQRCWGVRALDWLWRTLIDPSAAPALNRALDRA
ncbi:MAG: phosphatase PAP2 family protein [Phycisphaerales bacterium]